MTVESSLCAELHLDELQDRISWLIRLRWLATAGVLITIWAAPRVLGVSLQQPRLYALAAGLAVYNAALWTISVRAPQITQGRALCLFANVQIAFDLIFLTALLHFAGGIENPLSCYYVFHVIIASILLSSPATFFQATLAMLLFAFLIIMEAIGRFPHYHLGGVVGPEVYHNPVYLFAALFALATMLFFAAFMATSITARLRQRENDVVRLSAMLKAHSDDLEHAYATLNHLDRERADYLHRAAHHLRSPLATLERMLSVVCEGRLGAVSSAVLEMLERARSRTQGMLSLVRDLLVLSRAREASQIVHRTTVNLADLVWGTVEDFQQQAEQAGITITTALPSGGATILGDSEGLAEMLENLLSNAIKYTSPGGRVCVTLERESDKVILTVQDSGIGIPPSEQERIFDEFYRATNARDADVEGTGLGLTIVKTIVESHGGTLAVKSQLGSGTTFTITLMIS